MKHHSPRVPGPCSDFEPAACLCPAHPASTVSLGSVGKGAIIDKAQCDVTFFSGNIQQRTICLQCENLSFIRLDQGDKRLYLPGQTYARLHSFTLQLCHGMSTDLGLGLFEFLSQLSDQLPLVLGGGDCFPQFLLSLTHLVPQTHQGIVSLSNLHTNTTSSDTLSY